MQESQIKTEDKSTVALAKNGSGEPEDEPINSMLIGLYNSFICDK